MKGKHLSREEEKEAALTFRKRGDVSALHRLARSQAGLVVTIACGYRKSAVPLDDLVQEGHLGLLHALKKFNPDRGARLTTYASYWIRAYILNAILRQHGPLRTFTSNEHRKIFFGLARAKHFLNGSANPKTIATFLGVPERDVLDILPRMAGGDVSLDAPLSVKNDGRTETTRANVVPSDLPGPEDAFGAKEEREDQCLRLSRALRSLPPRDRDILRARFAEEPETLEEIGKRLGVSRERVRQLERRALGVVRKRVQVR